MKKFTLIFVVVMLAALVIAPTAALADDVPLLNLKMNFMDKDNYAMAGYIITIDNDHQSVTDKNGVASFPAVDATGGDTFKVFTPDGKKVVSICNLFYQQSDKTDVGPAVSGGGFILYYSTPNATIYVDMIADPNGDINTLMHPAAASDSPLPTGKQRPAPTAAPKPSASSTPRPTTVTNPTMEGYLVDSTGMAMAGDIVSSRNDDTGNTLSGTTDQEGYYFIQGISEGKHTISVYEEENPAKLGSVNLYVEAGKSTSLSDVDGDGVLDIQTGLNKLYVNLQLNGDKTITVLDVSDAPLNSPATSTEPPTPQPTETAMVTPTVAPTGEAPTAPGPTAGPAASTGMDSSLMIILIVAIVAVAAVVIVLIVVKSKKNN